MRRRERWTRRSVLAGAGVTFGLTALLFVLTRVIPLEPIRALVFEATGNVMRDNPFKNLHFLTGLPGGYVAGYLTDGRWYDGSTNGLRATALAGLALYLIVVGYNLYLAAASGGPVAVYVVVVAPTLLLFPLVAVLVIEGSLAGMLGTWIRRT